MGEVRRGYRAWRCKAEQRAEKLLEKVKRLQTEEEGLLDIAKAYVDSIGKESFEETKGKLRDKGFESLPDLWKRLHTLGHSRENQLLELKRIKDMLEDPFYKCPAGLQPEVPSHDQRPLLSKLQPKI